MGDIADYAFARALREGKVDGGGAGAELYVRDMDGEGARGGTAEEGGVEGESVRLFARREGCGEVLSGGGLDARTYRSAMGDWRGGLVCGLRGKDGKEGRRAGL